MSQHIKHGCDHIFFIGFLGAGKSTLARNVGTMFKRRFIDTDRLVVRRCGKSVTEIFETEGEEVALVNAVQWSQTARKDVLMATNPSARHALDFGKTGERTLRACLGDAASQVPAYQLLSEGMRFEARLAHDACDFDIDYVFEVDDCLEDFGIEELAFDLEPAAYIEEFRKQQFARSNRSMLPLPAALGAIRLTSVEDEVLERHTHAYLASRKELL